MDWKTAVAVFLPIVTLVLGGVLQRWNASSVEKAQMEREQKLREAERRQARLDRREEFELQHLVEVNQLLHDLMAGLLRMATITTLQDRHGADDDTELIQEWQEVESAADATHTALTAQSGFILNDGIRTQVKTALDVIDKATGEIMEADTSTAGLQAAGAVLRPAFEAISARVRELYADRAGA